MNADLFKNWKLIGIIGVAFVVYATLIYAEKQKQ